MNLTDLAEYNRRKADESPLPPAASKVLLAATRRFGPGVPIPVGALASGLGLTRVQANNALLSLRRRGLVNAEATRIPGRVNLAWAFTLNCRFVPAEEL